MASAAFPRMLRKSMSHLSCLIPERWRSADAALEIKTKNTKRAQAVEKAADSLTIYIVDDDDDVGHIFARLFRSMGISARTYRSSDRFLEELIDGERACILLDIALPRVAEQAALARLKELGKRHPIIVISSRDDDVTRTAACDLGAKMFLSRPVDDQALIDAINWATDSKLGQ
jgi:FixJ family two-component response regulator